MLTPQEWRPRAEAHAARVDVWVQPFLERRARGQKHPVEDFLFTYYSQRPAGLRRWHPGFGVGLLDAPELADRRGYSLTTWSDEPDSGRPGRQGVPLGRGVTSVTPGHLVDQVPLVEATRRLLVATAGRPPTLGCFGLHEWAMVHRAAPTGSDGDGVLRHDRPLRLGGAGTDAVVEASRITCSHFDAFRFFTPSAAPLNLLRPSSGDRVDFEQPGCLHAGMDLYKHAFRLTPLVPSELVADCFALAWDVRDLDMRASPYDFADLGLDPVRIETPAGRQEYAAAQRAFAERGAPLRARLVAECDRLLTAAHDHLYDLDHLDHLDQGSVVVAAPLDGEPG